MATGKTAKSILISAAVRLAAFNLPEIAKMTSYDTLDIGSLGEKKKAIFCVIPDSDNSFNYLVGMLYTQAFQSLYYNADHEHGGELPIPVHILMDEFANVALPDSFENKLATMRSRRISVSIIIQNMAQLKALFKDSWENITGNCDTLLYLGGNEQSTHEYISKMLGKTPEMVAGREQSNAPKTSDAPQENQVKTKENYIQAHTDGKAVDVKPEVKVKTKENYIESHSDKSENKEGLKQKPNKPQTPKSKGEIDTSSTVSGVKTPKQARQEYVTKKIKTKAEYEKAQSEAESVKNNGVRHTESYSGGSQEQQLTPENMPKDKQLLSAEKPNTADGTQPKSSVKTKESYMRSLRAEKSELIHSSYQTVAPKSKSQTVSRSTANTNKAVKTKQNVSKTNKTVKSGNVYKSASSAKKTAQKAKKTKKAVKTQKEVSKKAAKEAAKKAKVAAQKAAQAAKATAKVVARIAVKVAQLVAAAVTKLVSALVAMGGWAVLIVVLIIVIIVAAIAASPFGVFISDEAADSDSIPISSIVAECNVELSTKLTEIEDSTPHNRVVMEGEQANWDEIIAFFAVKTAGTDDETAQDVVVITEEKKQKLKDVFWDMNNISSRTAIVSNGETSETVLYITITAKTKEQMIEQYSFTDRQQEALETLLENNDVLISATQSLAISDATAQEVLKSLPDNLPAKRKAVVKAACSLVGKVNYFWGGKSSALGWDSNWGKMALVTAEGSRSSGSMRPFGLDCSGFVTWAFINSSFNANDIGHGTQGQIGKCSRISWSAAQPGDLAFYSDLSHVGIVAGRDISGNVLVIHCSSGANNVVITTGGFGFAARPYCF